MAASVNEELSSFDESLDLLTKTGDDTGNIEYRDIETLVTAATNVLDVVNNFQEIGFKAAHSLNKVVNRVLELNPKCFGIDQKGYKVLTHLYDLNIQSGNGLFKHSDGEEDSNDPDSFQYFPKLDLGMRFRIGGNFLRNAYGLAQHFYNHYQNLDTMSIYDRNNQCTDPLNLVVSEYIKFKDQLLHWKLHVELFEECAEKLGKAYYFEHIAAYNLMEEARRIGNNNERNRHRFKTIDSARKGIKFCELAYGLVMENTHVFKGNDAIGKRLDILDRTTNMYFMASKVASWQEEWDKELFYAERGLSVMAERSAVYRIDRNYIASDKLLSEMVTTIKYIYSIVTRRSSDNNVYPQELVGKFDDLLLITYEDFFAYFHNQTHESYTHHLAEYDVLTGSEI